MAIVFYYAPFSSAVRVHWALEELGVPYEGVKIDFKSGELKKPEFLKLNPNGKVPTLVDDGVPYFESIAILIFLGEKYGKAKGLWPAAGTHAHGQAMSWTVWAAATLLNAGTRVMANTSAEAPEDTKNAKQGEAALKEFEGLIGLLDTRLSSSPYLTGDDFTLTDALLAADLWWYQMVIKPDMDRWPHLKAWAGRCMDRPAFKRISVP
jgi:glutathione S-transferase